MLFNTGKKIDWVLLFVNIIISFLASTTLARM